MQKLHDVLALQFKNDMDKRWTYHYKKHEQIDYILISEALKTKFGDAEAKVIVREIEKIESSVDTKVANAFDKKKDVLSTKEDIAKLEHRMLEKFNDQLKWMIVMWISQLGAIVAFMKMFMK